MRSVSCDEELGVSSNRAFQNAVVIVVSGDNSDPLGRMHQMGHPADRPDTRRHLLFAQAKLIPQDSLGLGEDRGGHVQIQLSAAGASQDLVGLAPWEGQRRD